jgi:hypothetical protein
MSEPNPFAQVLREFGPKPRYSGALVLKPLISWPQEPTQKPDPAHVNGMRVDHSRGAKRTCTMAMPYPNPGYVRWELSCSKCGQRAETSGVGRPDDPITFTVACLRKPKRWWQFWRWKESK